MDPVTLLKAAKVVKPKRFLKFLPIVLVLAIVPPVMGFLLILMPIAWLFSPFQHTPPPPSLAAVTKTYLPIETAAVRKYSGCYVVKVSQFNGSQTVYVREWRIHKVDVSFVQAIMEQESGGDARAISSAGAFGLMQVTFGKFSRYIKKGTSPLDPKTNVMVGTEFLDYLYTLFHGNLPLVAAAYNAGPGRVQQWIAEYHATSWSEISSHQAVQTFAKGQTYHYVNNVMQFYSEFSAGYAPAQACGPLPPAPPSSGGSNGSSTAGGG